MYTCIIIAAAICFFKPRRFCLSNLVCSRRTFRSLSFELLPPKSTLFLPEESPVKNMSELKSNLGVLPQRRRDERKWRMKREDANLDSDDRLVEILEKISVSMSVRFEFQFRIGFRFRFTGMQARGRRRRWLWLVVKKKTRCRQVFWTTV